MKTKAIEKSIKSLKKIIKYYKKNPCDLDMGKYENCAMGTYLNLHKGVLFDHENVSSVFKKLFGFSVYDVTDDTLYDLRECGNVFEYNVTQLFCARCYGVWERDVSSKKWIKQAKKVIKKLEKELETRKQPV